MTRYSFQPRDQIIVKGYWLLPFAKIIGKYLSRKYSQKLLDIVKKSATDALKTTSKWVIQKTTEAACNSIGYKIVNEIVNNSPQNNSNTDSQTDEKSIERTKEWYLSPEKNDELRLIQY